MTRVVVTGAAGLVGQNLIPRLKQAPGVSIACIDKNASNLKILSGLHPDIEVIDSDLARDGAWNEAVRNCDVLVQLHAQIGGLEEKEFTDNNITATIRVLDECRQGSCSYIVHASSSVVNSMANDFYTESKKAQEKLVSECGIKHVTLRPTLMFGWFDRKHVGWLQRFMKKAPVFPIPGDGKYLRQPLYAGDFCAIINSCIARQATGVYDITGLDRIDYIDLIRAVRDVSGVKTPILKVPYGLFWLMLKTYALVDKNPPFTTSQLKALATPDIFDVIDWPGIFGVPATPLRDALEETFNHPEYSKVTLEF